MTLIFILVFLALLSAATSESPGELLCDDKVFGRVPAFAADEIDKGMPFSKPKSTKDYGQLSGRRAFAEPVYFNPVFNRMQRPAEYASVQLPKVWKRQKANVALLSYGNIHNWVDYPAVVSTWDKVHNALTALRIHCAKDLSQGGVYVMLASYGDKVLPQMVVYLYAAGAPFEEAVNRYMLTNRAIRPYNPLGLDGADLQADFVSANLTDNAYNSSGVLPDDAFHLLNSSWTSTTTNRENGHYEIPNSLAKETS